MIRYLCDTDFYNRSKIYGADSTEKRMDMQIIDGGVNAPKGYEASGVEAGIKYENRKDMALVYTKEAASVAGTFTTNVVKAAPVVWDKEVVESGKSVHAVVLNSGIANAATGKEGKEYNYEMASEIAKVLDVLPEEVLTASTGVIGMQLRMEPIRKAAPLLKEALTTERDGAIAAAEAIMTTDTTRKECAVTFEQEGRTITVGGMSKGSGMIHPNMATMLSVITTDAKVSPETLQEMLGSIVKDSFNMISVDRDTSTNDTCLLLANGAAGAEEIKMDSKEYEALYEAVSYVATELAKKMAADGEGCTRLLEVTVKGAKTKEEAVILSKSVISSNLVKTAIYGKDANCGRVLCALGYAGVDFDPEVVDLTLYAGGEELVWIENGVLTDFSEEKATEMMGNDVVTLVCNMKQGDAEATAWGCDLTYDYIKINADYRS